MTCGLCGLAYEPGGAACRVHSCPLAFGGCSVSHCPRCGFTAPASDGGLTGWLRGLLNGRARPGAGVHRLVDLPAGQEGHVERVEAPPDVAGLLTVLGVTPGVRFRLHQTRPTYVADVGGTEIAFEREVAEGVLVRI